MYVRTGPASQEHDQILNTAAQRLDRTKYKVYTNPGQQHNAAVGTEYPDIVVTPLNSNNVQFIIEVETADSVNDAEAAQWQSYSKLGGTFYLLVPHGSLQTARNICLRNGIRAKFAYYWLDEKSQLGISYE